MNFRLVNHGSVFSTRDRGIRLLADLAKERAQNQEDRELTIDFEGVHSVTSSFADEFVGKLMQRAHDEEGDAPQILNMNSNVATRVRRALSYRGLDPQGALVHA